MNYSSPDNNLNAPSAHVMFADFQGAMEETIGSRRKSRDAAPKGWLEDNIYFNPVDIREAPFIKHPTLANQKQNANEQSLLRKALLLFERHLTEALAAKKVPAVQGRSGRHTRSIYKKAIDPEGVLLKDKLDKQALRNLAKISSFVTLKAGWDGYRAEPISKELADFCKSLIVSLPKNKQPDVFPTPRGTVQLEYEDEERYLEIEVSQGAFTVYGTNILDQDIEETYVDWDSVLKLIERVNA